MNRLALSPESASDPLSCLWDGYGLDNPYGGIGRSAWQLADALSELSSPDAPLVIDLLTPKSARLDKTTDGSALGKVLPLPSLPTKMGWWLGSSLAVGFLQMHWRLLSPRNGDRERGRRWDVVHGFANFNLPWVSRLSAKLGSRTNGRPSRPLCVLTIHDVIPLLADSGLSWHHRAQMRALLPMAVRLADRLICVSAWTASTVAELFPQHQQKIRVIPHGGIRLARSSDGKDPGTNEQELPSAVPAPSGMHGEASGELPSALAVLRYEPYKRLDLLLEIYLLLAAKGWQLDLVTCRRGKRFVDEWLSRQSGKALSALVPQLTVHTAINDDAARTLWQRAHCLLHTARYEGFGLPVAEALSHGLPVLYTEGTASDEWARGQAGAIGVPLHAKADDWACAALTVAGLRFGELHRKNQVIAWRQSRPWSWSDAASAYLGVYNEAR